MLINGEEVAVGALVAEKGATLQGVAREIATG
jgi:hypothetical protein